MHTWHWHTWEELPYLRCSLLENFPHGFFTQQFWSRSLFDMTKILHPDAKLYRLKQVHGNRVVTPLEVDIEENALVPADALISQQPRQALWTASADCTPALIADIDSKQVAAIHAGWRGTAKKIIPTAIARMQSQGSQLPDLRIAMGPAIDGQIYQVSTSVAAQIGASIIPHEDQKAILDGLNNLPNSPLLPDSEPGKVRIDVRRVNALQMEQMGISGEQMAIAPYCTFQTPEHFFSYRRAKEKKVQWSGIVSL